MQHTFSLNLTIYISVMFCSFNLFSQNASSSSSPYPPIQNMTLEEKIGQILMVHVHAEDVSNNSDAISLIQNDFIGGIIYYNWANGLKSPLQVQQLSRGLQALARQNRLPIPLLIAVDQEGGLVARLREGFTIFPGNMSLAMTGNPLLADQSAFAMGVEMRAVGVNVNLAPVADIINPTHSVIGIRSFGDSPETVALYAQKALEGYHRANIITALKHFPGYGEVVIDPHEDLPVLHKSREDLQKRELQPFLKLSKCSDMVMTAHLLVPSLDSDRCTTLSKKTLEGVLRQEIGFEGIIISDSLVMQGALKNCPSIDETVIQAFEAGCDILCIGGRQLLDSRDRHEQTAADIHRICQSLISAVKGGRISEARLDRSVEKILRLKADYSLSEEPDNMLPFVNCKEHRKLTNKIAKSSIKVLQNNLPSEFSFDKKRIAVFVPKIVSESFSNSSFSDSDLQMHTEYFDEANFPSRLQKQALEISRKGDLTIVFAYNAWKYPDQQAFIDSLIKIGKPVVLVCLRDAEDADLFPKAKMIMATYSPTTPSVHAACNFILKLYDKN